MWSSAREGKKYPNDANAIKHLYSVLNKQTFKYPDELGAIIPSLDSFKYEDKWWVIDVGGINLRMVPAIQFFSPTHVSQVSRLPCRLQQIYR